MWETFSHGTPELTQLGQIAWVGVPTLHQGINL